MLPRLCREVSILQMQVECTRGDRPTSLKATCSAATTASRASAILPQNTGGPLPRANAPRRVRSWRHWTRRRSCALPAPSSQYRLVETETECDQFENHQFAVACWRHLVKSARLNLYTNDEQTTSTNSLDLSTCISFLRPADFYIGLKPVQSPNGGVTYEWLNGNPLT